jgi:Asp/Glu/hydantoin racemase
MLYRTVRGATSSRVVGTPDRELLEPFVTAARELVTYGGVQAITTSCGFLAMFQRELAAAVPVPVLSSALMQVPMVSRMIGEDRSVGILTVRPSLTEEHFTGVGWSSAEVPVNVQAMPGDSLFSSVYAPLAGQPEPVEARQDTLRREVVEAALRLVANTTGIGAIVLECTNLVPYSQNIRIATGLPVFDLYTLVVQTCLATTGIDHERAATIRQRVGSGSV